MWVPIWDKWGKTGDILGGYPYWILTTTKGFFRFRSADVCADAVRDGHTRTARASPGGRLTKPAILRETVSVCLGHQGSVTFVADRDRRQQLI